MPPVTVRVQPEPFDAAALSRRLTENRTDIGALVAFTGLCRDEANTLQALELEHYPGMAEAQLDRIAGQACARWPLLGLALVHRVGLVRPGEPIVFVGAASAHRAAAFEAASFVMDFLKTDAPFWKKEHGAALSGNWVAPKSTDDDALARWR